MIILNVDKKVIDRGLNQSVSFTKGVFLVFLSLMNLSVGLSGNTAPFFSIKSHLFILFPLIIFLIIGYIGFFSLKRKFKNQAVLLKKSRDVARKNEKKYRLLAENTSDVVWLSDLDFNLSYISPSVEKMLGGTVYDHMSLPIEKKVPVEKVKKLKAILNEAIEQEKLTGQKKNSRILELKYNRLDGSSVWVEMNVSFVRDANGTPTGLHGITRDITEKVKARQKMERRLAVEKLLSKISRKAIHDSDINHFIQEILKKVGLTMDVSRVYIFSYNSQSNTVSNTFEWCAKKIEPQISNLQLLSVDEFSWFLNKLMHGKVIKYKDINRIPDEVTKANLNQQDIVSILAVPLILKDKFYGFIGLDECREVKSWQDFEVKALHSIAYIITSLVERHETGTELRIKNLSMELSMIGKAISDLEGKVTYVNQSFLDYWRYETNQDALGKSVFDFWKSTTESEKVVSSIKKHGKWKGELKAVRSDGTLFDALVQASLVTNEEGNPICMQASFYDITERKIRERELLEAKEKAEESSRLKSAFLQNMSHEIRTPMNGILGFTNLLQNFNLTTQEQEDYIHLVNESGKRLMSTINDLLEISVIEVGDITMSEDDVDLPELMEQTCNLFKPEAHKKNLFLKFNCKDESLWIKTDKNKLACILEKLINNALKFTDKGGVEFGAELKDDMLHFHVKDTGQGILPDQKERLFHPFIQQDMGLARRHEGTGLGLSISKAYVEKLGGKIWFESQKGMGSTFYFTIPYTPSQIKRINTDAGNLLSGKKILVAEDDLFSYLLLESLLKSLGAEVLHSQTGKETVEVFRKNQDITLILMDIKMPVMDGIEATREIRAINKSVPIIAQTALVFPVDNKDILEAGCNDYIPKPIDQDVLLGKMKQYLFN